MRPRHTHLWRPWYRPRTQGGDTHHPACMAPKVGWAGPEYLTWPTTQNPAKVDCPFCLAVMTDNRRPVRLADHVAKPPRRGPRGHALHLRLVWASSQGLMFPFGAVRWPEQARAE